MRNDTQHTFFEALITVSLLTSASIVASTVPQRVLSMSLPMLHSVETVKASVTENNALKGVDSAYTSLDLDGCETLERSDETDYQELRCAGYQDIPLYITTYHGGMDLDVGVQNSEWIHPTTATPANRLHDTVEWRLHNNKPTAVILRYFFNEADGENSMLGVFSIGREGSPGCLVGWVSGNARPNQNIAARNLADTRANAFNCSVDQPFRL